MTTKKLGLYLILRNIPMPRGQTPAPLNKFKAPPPPRVRELPRLIELAHTTVQPPLPGTWWFDQVSLIK